MSSQNRYSHESWGCPQNAGCCPLGCRADRGSERVLLKRPMAEAWMDTHAARQKTAQDDDLNLSWLLTSSCCTEHRVRNSLRLRSKLQWSNLCMRLVSKYYLMSLQSVSKVGHTGSLDSSTPNPKGEEWDSARSQRLARLKSSNKMTNDRAYLSSGSYSDHRAQGALNTAPSPAQWHRKLWGTESSPFLRRS